MASIREELDKLEDKQLSYVIERSRTTTNAEAFRASGVSQSTYNRWGSETCDALNDLARRMKREAALKAKLILEDVVEDAATLLASHVRNDGAVKKIPISLQQKAAIEILDRIAGKPTQRQEISGPDGSSITVRWDVTETGND